MSDQRVITPTAGRVAKRAVFWVGVGVFVLLVAVVAFATAGSGVQGDPLDPENPAPAGAMALAEVLKQQGVEVTVTDSLEATTDAIVDPATTTLVLHDVNDILDADQSSVAASLASVVVLIDPYFEALDSIAPELAQAGAVSGELTADCSVSAVQKAGSVSGGGTGFRVIDADARAVTCLRSADDVYSLIELTRDEGTLIVLGTTEALSNEHVIERGNAALALNLLGGTPNLVWYQPGIDDVADTTPATLGELTPAWVTPVLSLLVITFIVAAIWRGRRFGPLVIENLPVTVRASETMLGRARLYEKSSSRLRALDALRIGTIQRLATLCGLPRVASVDEVIAAAAAIAHAQPGEVRRILVDAQPASDHDLLALSDQLLALEREVQANVRP
jgi:hypothetical protein